MYSSVESAATLTVEDLVKVINKILLILYFHYSFSLHPEIDFFVTSNFHSLFRRMSFTEECILMLLISLQQNFNKRAFATCVLIATHLMDRPEW